MIQPLKSNSNINFCANTSVNKTELFKDFQQQKVTSKTQNSPEVTAPPAHIEQKEPKESIFKKIRNGAINTLKGFNTTTNTSIGFIKGVAAGSVTTCAVAAIGKNIKEADGKILGTLKGVAKDMGKGAKKAILAAPSLITKAPIENAKTLATMPKKFYKEYLKGNKAIGALATVSGIAVLAFNTLKGKVIANKKNADVDHYTNTGHIKTK